MMRIAAMTQSYHGDGTESGCLHGFRVHRPEQAGDAVATLLEEAGFMSLDSVKADLARRAPDIQVLITQASSATVTQAAAAHGVEPARIAKTLSLRVNGRVVLVVTRGDARLDNKKVKAAFGAKASMLAPEEVEMLTGHPVGGVCPFGLAQPLPVYCDVSLAGFDEVVPAAGSGNSAIRISPQRLAELTAAEWVDVCQDCPAVGGRGEARGD
jgi:prolyl-tRNA editing enzyme YbaK/EbsC (Cys-tRNA(Pro) deacylase)